MRGSATIRYTLIAFLMTAAGCDRRADPVVREVPGSETSPSADAEVAVAPPNECIDSVEGYSVEFPASWTAHADSMFGPCKLFDPNPIEIPQGSELPIEIAVIISFEPVQIEELAGEVLGRRNLVREQTAVDGREAIRIEGETTGEGLYDRGIRSYQYFVDLGDSTMVAATYDRGPLTFDDKRRILDSMMATFDFRQPS